MSDFKDMIGTTLGGRYLLLKNIGEGGMAVVFAAYDRVSGETVAIKLLNENAAGQDQSLSDLKKQFADEARIHSMVSHPAIAGFRQARLDSSPLYFVMEYVDGVTLIDYMRRNRGLTEAELLDFSCRILSALSHIHAKGIVHCDIKPQNVIVTPSGKVKLTDFGIARMAGKSPDLPKDKAVGTVYYVSPEQAEGKALDHRSDIYSLGIMMYQMASGRLPFTGKDLDRVAQMQASAPPPRPRQIDPTISKGLEQIILKAIAKKPYMRFDSADEMRRYLEILKKNPYAVFRLQTKQSLGYGRYQPRSVLSVLAGSLAAFILVAAIAIPTMYSSIFRGADGKAASMRVPDLRGYTCSDAEEQLDGRYYDVDIIYTYNSGRIPGIVVDQSPASGTRVSIEPDEQYTVTLTVSAEVRQLTMIDVTSMTPAEAELALNREGYSVIFENSYSDTVTEGRVSATLPACGSPATAGSTVTVYISRGADIKTTLVPDLVGSSESEAARLIEENGLRVGKVVYRASSLPIGTVISHSSRGQSVTVGSAIDFEISGGKDYQ